MAYFVQQSALSGTFLPDGRKITLDFINDGQDGYISSDNGYVVNQIRAAIASKSGGWMEVTQAEYDEALKKKANPSQSNPRRLRALSAGLLQNLRGNPVAPAAEVAAKPEPIAVPKPEQMKLPPRPRVGKLVK